MVASMQNGEKIRYAGLVICRQRPGTAGGVVFMTLEDETGFVNVVVWESVFQRYAVLAKTVSFLGISGKLQAEDGVVHLVAEALMGAASRAEAGEYTQPRFSLRKLAAKNLARHRNRKKNGRKERKGVKKIGVVGRVLNPPSWYLSKLCNRFLFAPLDSRF